MSEPIIVCENLVKIFKVAELEVVALQAVSYTHLRAHETVLDIVCRLLLEKKKPKAPNTATRIRIIKLEVTF